MDDPLLNKMHQLMSKYQGQSTTVPVRQLGNDADIELPVLTDIVRLGDETLHNTNQPTPANNEELAWQIMQTVERRLQAELESAFNDQIQQAITTALSESLPLFRQHITSIVRTSIHSTLAQHGIDIEREPRTDRNTQ